MICDALITFFMYYLLFRMDIMQICMQRRLCGCTCISSSFVVVIFELESFHTSNRKLTCCMCIFQHFGKHLCQQPWLFPACVWCRLCLMRVTSCFPSGKESVMQLFHVWSRGDGCTTDRSPWKADGSPHINSWTRTHITWPGLHIKGSCGI